MPNVVRGDRMAGLLVYLLGPGRANEHTEPHLVAGDAAMLAWQLKIKQRGLLTAIVSNMGDAVHEHMERELDWLSRFDVLVWSYQLRVAKPDPAIYHYALERLGTRPEETLFLDDRAENVDTAVALGMRGLVFSTVEKLRADLIDSGLSKELPLP